MLRHRAKEVWWWCADPHRTVHSSREPGQRGCMLHGPYDSEDLAADQGVEDFRRSHTLQTTRQAQVFDYERTDS